MTSESPEKTQPKPNFNKRVHQQDLAEFEAIMAETGITAADLFGQLLKYGSAMIAAKDPDLSEKLKTVKECTDLIITETSNLIKAARLAEKKAAERTFGSITQLMSQNEQLTQKQAELEEALGLATAQASESAALRDANAALTSTILHLEKQLNNAEAASADAQAAKDKTSALEVELAATKAQLAEAKARVEVANANAEKFQAQYRAAADKAEELEAKLKKTLRFEELSKLARNTKSPSFKPESGKPSAD